MQVFRVQVPFARLDRATGQMIFLQKGDLVADPATIADIRGGEQSAFGHMTQLPDDHPAVLPTLPDDHPARLAFVDRRQHQE